MGKTGKRLAMNKSWMKKAVGHPALGLLLRIYIGAIFIAASMYKINYPGEFAETIASYQMVPFWAVNLMALVMPWTELICGMMLVLGLRTRASAVSDRSDAGGFLRGHCCGSGTGNSHRMRLLYFGR